MTTHSSDPTPPQKRVLRPAATFSSREEDSRISPNLLSSRIVSLCVWDISTVSTLLFAGIMVGKIHSTHEHCQGYRNSNVSPCCCHSFRNQQFYCPKVPNIIPYLSKVVIKKKKTPSTLKRDANRKRSYLAKKFQTQVNTQDKGNEDNKHVKQLQEEVLELTESIRETKEENIMLAAKSVMAQSLKIELGKKESAIEQLETDRVVSVEELCKLKEELEFHRMNSASVSSLQEQMEQEKNTHESLIKTAHDKIDMYKKQLREKDIKVQTVTSDFLDLKHVKTKKDRILSAAVSSYTKQFEEGKKLVQQLYQQKEILNTELSKKDQTIQSLSLDVSSLESRLREAASLETKLDLKDQKLDKLQKEENCVTLPLINSIKLYDQSVQGEGHPTSKTKMYFKLLAEWAKFHVSRPLEHCSHKRGEEVKIRRVIDRVRSHEGRKNGYLHYYEDYLQAELTCNCPPKWFVWDQVKQSEAQEFNKQRIAKYKTQSNLVLCIMKHDCDLTIHGPPGILFINKLTT